MLLIGSTGTGKTNLVDSLAEVLPSARDRFHRTNRSKAYLFNIEGKYFRIVDVPGQDMHESERVDTIRESLKKVEGILHVVCYGYHEGKDISISDALIDDNNPNKAFLENQRKKEINDLVELSKFYGIGSKATWIVTVISKADLWWSQRQEVVNYYSRGEYSQSLKGILPNMKRGCVEYCSVIHKFYGSLKLSGDFDDRERIKCKNEFINTILEMTSANKRKKIL